LLAAALLLAAWIAIALFFAAVVAPAAFAVSPTRSLAGALVSRVLPAVLVTGLLVGGFAAVMDLTSGRRGWWRTGSSLGLAVACGIAQFAIGTRISNLRAQIGPSLEELAADDARRVAFGKLHALSVAWLGIAILAAVVALIASVLVLRSRS
jgi:hypothetical protein